jgi:signal peptidase I
MATGMQDGGKAQEAGMRGMARGFAKEILVPILLALVVIQFVIQAFKIPSASMEDSLLIGDFLLGIKFVYGSPIPFSEKKLPGLSDPKPGDVLIFKYPGDPLYPGGDRERYAFLANLFLFGNLYWDRQAPPDGKRLVWYQPKDFIKRCVAQSGQTLEVSGTRILVDGAERPLPRKGKYKPPQARGFEPQRDSLHYRLPAPGETLDFDTLTLKEASWIRSLAHQENPGRKVELILDLMRDSVADSAYVLPYLHGDPREPSHQGVYALLKIRYGMAFDGSTPYYRAENVPFSLVKEAARTGFITVTDLMYPPGYPDTSTASKRMAWKAARRQEFNEYFMGHYLDLIQQNVAGQGQQAGERRWIRARLAIDGKASDTYTVRKKCYFMMGDNRDNSSDGRYWGLLSKDYVKAKAFIIYFSLDDEEGAIRLANPLTWLKVPFHIRWTRIGKLID